MEMKRKNPILAGGLSFIIAGVGQLYLNRLRRGAMFFTLEIATAFYATYSNEQVGLVLNFLVSVIAATDAYRIAKMLNKEKPPPPKQELFVEAD